MSVDLKIVIPSYRRADKVTTNKTALPADKCILCVPDEQVAEYREHNPDSEIVGHPDDMVGLTPKRNWISKRFGSHMQIDDDQKHFVHFEHAVGEPECKLAPETAYGVLRRLADMADELGIYLFSLSPYPDIRVFNPMTPFRVTGFAIGGKLGWLHPEESGLWLNERIVAKDDYWISALNAYKHRMCLVDMRYGSKFTPDFTTAGGQGGMRTTETEQRDTKLLVEAFGSEVIAPKRRTVRSKGIRGHDDQVTLILPF